MTSTRGILCRAGDEILVTLLFQDGSRQSLPTGLLSRSTIIKECLEISQSGAEFPLGVPEDCLKLWLEYAACNTARLATLAGEARFDQLAQYLKVNFAFEASFDVA
jgi:hypothetical protein